MTRQEIRATNRGFTLLETIIYIALFSLLFTGVLASSYSFFTGAEHISRKVATENEAAFVVRKIGTLLRVADAVTVPSSGNSNTSLIFSTYAGDEYTFTITDGAVTLAEDSNPALPLTAERIEVSNFSATHTAPVNGLPRYLEYSFMVEEEKFGPMRTYFSF